MNALNWLDWVVLLGTMLGIALYGVWRTRGRSNLKTYLRGEGNTPWFVIGLSVMATQASAITFLSTPGQGYESGLGFVQNYFGAPFALILIAAVFIPIYQRCGVYTAYEYLGQRFDSKTRLLGAALFLFHRGIGAGITIYAPAIVISTVLNWPLNLTILGTGLLVIAYTVAGGSAAVNLTQKYQIGVIFIGMIAAFCVLVSRLPPDLTFTDALTVAGGMGRLEAVSFSLDPNKRYTFWSGLLGGMFLALSYFGADQSQVQRYLSGDSIRESRLGLMFNAVFKIPMQLGILLLGVMLFVFYQFEEPPVFFNQPAWAGAVRDAERSTSEVGNPLERLAAEHHAAYLERRARVQEWLNARHTGDAAQISQAQSSAQTANAALQAVRKRVSAAIKAANPSNPSTDADYVFVTFILSYLPHGLIGLLIAVFFAAALSSKAGELNALASTTTVDLYRHLFRQPQSDAHYLRASRLFTVFWGFVALAFALFAHMSENLIQAGNIVGSLFYGVLLGLFLVAFFLKPVHGTAVFSAAILSQVAVLVMFWTLEISYLWYNVIGCAACMVLSLVFQALLSTIPPRPPAEVSAA